ncbi:MAG TPA: hypothetical protein VGC17_01060 [Lactovum miscens]
MGLADNYYLDDEPDIDGNLRRLYKFPVRFIDDNSILSVESVPRNDNVNKKIYSKSDLERSKEKK